MKKRFLALLLAVCIAASMLVLPVSAAGNNPAVQAAVTLGGLTADQTDEASLDAALNRGQLAKLLTAFSTYRESAASQGTTGKLFSDVTADNCWAPYIRIAVQQGWLSGYTEGRLSPLPATKGPSRLRSRMDEVSSWPSVTVKPSDVP
mgnify:CR=1 FL=1